MEGSFQLNLAFTSFAKKKPHITTGKLFKKYLKDDTQNIIKSIWIWYQYFHACWSRKNKKKLFC